MQGWPLTIELGTIRAKKHGQKVPPRFELGLAESEPAVITTYTMGPYNNGVGPLRELNPGPLPP